jgi:hypothetical protein
VVAADAWSTTMSSRPTMPRPFSIAAPHLLTALGLICAACGAGCGGSGSTEPARPVAGLSQAVAALPWGGRLPSGESIRIHARGGASRIDCVDVRTGQYDSTDYCVTDSRSDLLDANSQLDCGTGDALIVGSVANDGLTLQLQPHQGRARNAIRFNAPTVTGSRRLLVLSFASDQLPVRLLLVDSRGKAVETDDIGDQKERCGGDDSKLLFGWL